MQVEKMFTKKVNKNQTYQEIMVPYLSNLSSEKAIFVSNQIKEQHETMKLQNEEATLKNTW